MRTATLAGFVFLSAASAARAEEPRADTLHPRLQDCRLVIDAHSVAPRRVEEAQKREQRVGDLALVVEGGRIELVKENEKVATWSAKLPDDQLVWSVVGDGDAGYVISYEADADGRLKRMDPELRIHVLDLRKGEWRDSLRIEGDKSGVVQPIQLSAIQASRGQIAVISLWGEHGTGGARSEATDYQVDCFRAGRSNPLWSRRFPLDEPREYDGVYLYGIPAPRYAESDIHPLTWMDDRLLVCAESRQPLQMLSRYSGRSLWRLGRVWEYQRGFIGPSCYSYYLGRFGIESGGEEGGAVDTCRKEFDAQWKAAIIGGPIVVPLPFERGGDAYSIFIAVLLSPRKDTSYLADCVLYEFNEKGMPISMGKVPQVIEGGSFAVDEGGVLWRGQNESFLHVVAAKRSPEITMGGGGPDCTLRIDWFRQISAPERDPWFGSGRAYDSVTFGERYAFSLTEGGFVSEEREAIYRFPVTATSVAEGTSETLMLEVPFDGAFQLPTTNYSKSGDRTRTRGPHLLGITGLQARGRILRVTMGREKSADVLEFDLGTTSLFSANGTADPAAERRQAAERRVKALKDVNQKDDNGQTPIFEAIHGTDMSYLRALLDAGADVKIKSKPGWTALMDAACYGSAEAVELLIKAGSDLNARDGNWGASPVLTWAVYSQIQPARKVRALLEAGADPGLADNKLGHTPLMGAVQQGNLPCIELLLAHGASIDVKGSDGKTALNLARDAKNEEVLKLLEEALKKK